MPQLWIIAGPNGSGKTTIADRWIAPRIPVVSPDAISVTHQVGPIQSGKLAIHAQEAYLAAGADFALDTTFSGNREIAIMERAASAGYKVTLVFVCVASADLCQARVIERVAGGGHAVPSADIVRRYERSLANLTVSFSKADRVFVLDNSAMHRRLVFSYAGGSVRYMSAHLPDWARTAIPKALQDK